MTDRAAGYVTDIGYTRAYHRELNPLATRLAFLQAGLEPPRIGTACELGFGQGVSLAIHAAATPIRWWGCDLNAGHVRFARSLDNASGAASTLVEATFGEFAARDDLPLFDFIGLQGVLSWVSAENRAVIARFIADRLAPGGVVYTSSNTLAVWADMLPLRELMADIALSGSTGGTAERIGEALALTSRIIDTHPLPARTLPGLAARHARLLDADRRYLAHEYFNRDWHPFAWPELRDLLASAGLRHACPAQLSDQLDVLNLTAAQRLLLAELTGTGLRETVREFLAAPSVRRDYWVRSENPLSGAASRAAWEETRIVLTTRRDDLPEVVSGRCGELRLTSEAHAMLVDALADGRSRVLGDLSAAAAFDLAAAGHLAIAQSDEAIERCSARADRLNKALDALDDENAVMARANAVTGGAA
ncbi:MAG: methyltransferase [Gammaproteobacteria bacterium]|nr:methyltransferase [Gammaproteobacteria bacterium]